MGIWEGPHGGIVDATSHSKHVKRRIAELFHYHGGNSDFEVLPQNRSQSERAVQKDRDMDKAKRKVAFARRHSELHQNQEKYGLGAAVKIQVETEDLHPLASLFEIGHAGATAHAFGCRGQLRRLAGAWSNGVSMEDSLNHARAHVQGVLHSMRIMAEAKRRRKAGLEELRGEASVIRIGELILDTEVVGNPEEDGQLIFERGENDRGDKSVNVADIPKGIDNQKQKLMNLFSRHFDSGGRGKGAKLLTDDEVRMLKDSFAAAAAHGRAILHFIDMIESASRESRVRKFVNGGRKHSEDTKMAIVHAQAHGAGLMHALSLVAKERNLEVQQRKEIATTNFCTNCF